MGSISDLLDNEASEDAFCYLIFTFSCYNNARKPCNSRIFDFMGGSSRKPHPRHLIGGHNAGTAQKDILPGVPAQGI